MDSREYDATLRALRTVEEWDVIPEGDKALFWSFGTVAPRILALEHWLVRSSSDCFSLLLDCLGGCAGLLGHIPPASSFESLADPVESFSQWRDPDAQSWLVQQVENLKFESSLNLICSCDTTKSMVEALFSASGLGGSCRRLSTLEWFDFLADCVEPMGWLYIPLPEITNFDLLVVSEAFGKRLSSAFSEPCAGTRVVWEEGRVFWPSSAEPARNEDLRLDLQGRG